MFFSARPSVLSCVGCMEHADSESDFELHEVDPGLQQTTRYGNVLSQTMSLKGRIIQTQCRTAVDGTGQFKTQTR